MYYYLGIQLFHSAERTFVDGSRISNWSILSTKNKGSDMVAEITCYPVDAEGSLQIILPTQNLDRTCKSDKESEAVLKFLRYK